MQRLPMRTYVIVAVILSLSLPCYAGMGLKQVYGLHDKISLQKFIQRTEARADLSNAQRLKMLGIAYHNLAVLKVKGASGKAVADLKKAYSLLPSDAEVLGYLGSGLTMRGRDSWNVLAKERDTKRGIRLIDRAVAKSPDSVVLRLLRANNSLSLPAFFHRMGVAKKDLQYLNALMTKGGHAGANSDIRAEVSYLMGVLYKDEGWSAQAERCFKKVILSFPNSYWAQKAQSRQLP